MAPSPATHIAPPDFKALRLRPPAEVFKDDARSRVWRTDAEPSAASVPWVFKQFQHAPWKQRLTARLGRHPAQREILWHDRLREAGLPAAEIVGAGVTADGQHWLVTPHYGPSLYNWLRHCDPKRDAAQRHDFTRQLGKITGQLLAMRVTHGDHKASNVVIRPTPEGDEELVLIDAGACRGSKGIPLLGAALPMLLNLHRNLQDAATYHDTPAKVKPTRADRLRFLKAMGQAWPSSPDGLQHLPRHREFAAQA